MSASRASIRKRLAWATNGPRLGAEPSTDQSCEGQFSADEGESGTGGVTTRPTRLAPRRYPLMISLRNPAL